jgi:hypothetical protein
MHGSFVRKRTQVALADDAQMAAVGMMPRVIKRALLGLVKALPTRIETPTTRFSLSWYSFREFSCEAFSLKAAGKGVFSF